MRIFPIFMKILLNKHNNVPQIATTQLFEKIPELRENNELRFRSSLLVK